MAREDYLEWPKLLNELNFLRKNLAENNIDDLIKQLRQIIQGYEFQSHNLLE